MPPLSDGPPHSFTLRRAVLDDQPILERLWLMFRHDLSEYTGLLPASDGTFRRDRLQSARELPGWAAYLITSAEHPIGLAVLRGLDEPVTVLNSFFVVRGRRRHGVGRLAVRELVDLHPGRWRVAFQDANPAAGPFWRSIAAENDRHFTEKRLPVPGRPELPPDIWITFTTTPLSR